MPEQAKGSLGYGRLGPSSRIYVAEDGIHIDDAAGQERLHMGRLTEGTVETDGTYGLKVTNSGGTVIIDGTSNMFKIVATGTLTQSGPNGIGGTYEKTVSALITTGLDYVPANLCMIEFSSNNGIVGEWVAWVKSGAFADLYGVWESYAAYVNHWSATQTAVVGYWGTSDLYDRSAISVDYRYNILKEQAF